MEVPFRCILVVSADQNSGFMYFKHYTMSDMLEQAISNCICVPIGVLCLKCLFTVTPNINHSTQY